MQQVPASLSQNSAPDLGKSKTAGGGSTGHSRSDSSTAYRCRVRSVQAQFLAVEPPPNSPFGSHAPSSSSSNNSTHLFFDEGAAADRSNPYSPWALLRASCLYRTLFHMHSDVIWRLAGQQLCYIKAMSTVLPSHPGPIGPSASSLPSGGSSHASAAGIVSIHRAPRIVIPTMHAILKVDSKPAKRRDAAAAAAAGPAGSEDEWDSDDTGPQGKSLSWYSGSPSESQSQPQSQSHSRSAAPWNSSSPWSDGDEDVDDAEGDDEYGSCYY